MKQTCTRTPARSPVHRLLLPLLCLLGVSALSAQTTVDGTISDAEGEPLIGVSVVAENTSTGTVTDVDGDFVLEVPAGTEALVFSYIGYQSVTEPIDGRASIDLTLSESSELLDEVVVVAYGTQKKVTITGAVASLQGTEVMSSPAVNATNSLAGRLPGLVVIQPSGEPGADAARVSIRGTNTLGNSSPLVVIDGIPDREGGFGLISPQDIESVSVLKDASAAIYGARAANGAILVTTKRGVEGRPTVTYDFNQGLSQPTVVPELADAVQYMSIMNELPIHRNIPAAEWGAAWESIQSTGTYDSPTADVPTLNAIYSPELIDNHANNANPWTYPNTDWFGATLREWAPQSRHNLAVRGGSEALRYFASLGYVDQDAVYINSATRYKQYNLRANFDATVNPYVKTNLGIMLRREDRRYPTESSGAIFRMLMRGRPNEPAVWPNGLPGPDIENGQNPVVITTDATGNISNPRDLAQLNGGVDLTNPWIEGLTLSLVGAVDRTNEQARVWQTPWTLYSWDQTTYEADGVTPVLEGAIRSNFRDARLAQSYNGVLNTNLTGLLRYDVALGQGNLSLLAGATREKFTGSNFNAFRRNFISTAIDQLFAGGAEQQNTGGNAYERTRLGYYGRAQYNFQQKYLAEFIWRYDGSYIFPEDQRFGFFPGFLAGWNVTEEDWLSLGGLDYLKLRASYGEMGNDQVFYNGQLQEYAFLSSYSFGQYPIGGVVQPTLVETVLANPDFTWERARNINFGIDATLFGGLDVALDYFDNRRDQILIQETGSTPGSSGITTLLPPVNAGKVTNSGVEFALRYNPTPNGEFRWNVGLNGGYARNKVLFLDEVPGAPDYQRQEGAPIGAYLIYENDGVFRDQAEIEANTLDYSGVTNALKPGDLKFKDTNGDGVIDADDQVRIKKNQTPTFNFGVTFGLTAGPFDASLLLQGATGALGRLQTESGDIGNYLLHQYDNRWTIDNPSSVDPRLASRGDTYFTGGPYGNNDYWLYSKNYVRLKNLEVGYRFGGNAFGGFLESARVYLNGFNLLTVDKLGIFDPESESQTGVYYPQSRVLNAGFSVSF